MKRSARPKSPKACCRTREAWRVSCVISKVWPCYPKTTMLAWSVFANHLARALGAHSSSKLTAWPALRHSSKALQTHAMATFHIHTLATTSCTKLATGGNGHGTSTKGWLSDNASDMSMHISSSKEVSLHACSAVSFGDWVARQQFVLLFVHRWGVFCVLIL